MEPMKYRIRMGDGSHREVEATGPKTARWEAERLALDAGIDEFDPAARAVVVRKMMPKRGTVRVGDANLCRCKPVNLGSSRAQVCVLGCNIHNPRRKGQ